MPLICRLTTYEWFSCIGGGPIFGVMVTADRSIVAEIPHLLFCKIIIVADIPKVADISENLR